MEGCDHAVLSWGATNLQKDVEEPFPADQVESFGEVDEGKVEGFFLLSALILWSTEGEDLSGHV